jgi:signal transduction histidine kinase
VTRQLLSVDGEQPLEVIARRLAELAEADVVTVVLPTFERTQLMIEVATGEGAEELTAATYPFKGTLSGLAIETGKPVLVSDVKQELKFSVHLSTAVEIGPAMAIPLLGYQGARGALLVGRKHGRKRFTDADLEMATTFASHATVALELADARADQQRMVLLEDRDRIARDLHDHVIQRLFSVGLTVQGVSSGLGGTELGGTDKAARLSRVVEDIDETIRQIRTSIFELRGSLVPDSSTLRQQLLETVTGTAEMLGFAPRVRFSGPIDAVVPESLADDLIAVLLESLTNVARHANATRVDVEISADSATLSVDILDDGMGIGDTLRRSGLRNLRQRAEKHGGTLTLPEHEGTHLRWTIPLV